MSRDCVPSFFLSGGLTRVGRMTEVKKEERREKKYVSISIWRVTATDCRNKPRIWPPKINSLFPSRRTKRGDPVRMSLLLLLHFPFFAPLHAVSVAARSSGADTLRTLRRTKRSTFCRQCRQKRVYRIPRHLFAVTLVRKRVEWPGRDGRVEGGKEKNRFVG